MSDGSQVLLRMVDEGGSPGTTPTDSTAWKQVQYRGNETFGANFRKVQDDTVTTDRIEQDEVLVGVDVNGGAPFNLRIGENGTPESWLDDIFAALFRNNWSSDQLVFGGTTDISKTFEKEFADIASGERFMVNRGCRVNTLQLQLNAQGIVSGNFGVLGTGFALATTSAVGSGSVAAPNSKAPIETSSGFGTLEVDDLASSILISAATLNFSNNGRAEGALGFSSPAQISFGNATLTGTLDLYLAANVIPLVVKAVNNGDVKIEFTLTDAAGDSWKFTIPVGRLGGTVPQGPGNNTTVRWRPTFRAVKNAVLLDRNYPL